MRGTMQALSMDPGRKELSWLIRERPLPPAAGLLLAGAGQPLTGAGLRLARVGARRRGCLIPSLMLAVFSFRGVPFAPLLAQPFFEIRAIAGVWAEVRLERARKCLAYDPLLFGS